MVAWWKRVLFSLASVVAAAVISVSGIVLESTIKNPSTTFRSSEVALTIAVTVGFCLIAWVLSAPGVLIVRNIRGWRFWLYWIVGSGVGPLLMLALSAVIFMIVPQGPGATWFSPALLPLLYLAAAISSLASLFYLLLFRWAQMRADRKAAAL
jgi:drug/metabolite transporter (DMT)-like permease